MRTNPLFDRWSPRLLSVLRIVAALLFLQHGTSKLFAVPPTHRRDRRAVLPLGAAGVIEVVGGALILLGLFTRPAAFICSGEMAFAYFLAHAPRGPLPNTNRASCRCCSASSSCIWRRPAPAPGAWMRRAHAGGGEKVTAALTASRRAASCTITPRTQIDDHHRLRCRRHRRHHRRPLAQAGHDVLLVDKAEDHVAAMNARGLTIESREGAVTIPSAPSPPAR